MGEGSPGIAALRQHGAQPWPAPKTVEGFVELTRDWQAPDVAVPEGHKDDLGILARGHCVQSRCLGFAYLVVVGLPSAAMAAMSLHSARRRDVGTGRGGFAARYRDRWPESWADRIAARRGFRGRLGR